MDLGEHVRKTMNEQKKTNEVAFQEAYEILKLNSHIRRRQLGCFGHFMRSRLENAVTTEKKVGK